MSIVTAADLADIAYHLLAMTDTLILAAAVLFLPLLAWVLRAAFAWRYGRMLRAGMTRGGLAADPSCASAAVTAAFDAAAFKDASLDGAPEVAPSQPLRVVVSAPSELLLGPAAERAFRRATRINHRAQFAFASAPLLSGVVVGIGMYLSLAETIVGYRRIALVYLALAPSIAVAVRVMNLRRRQVTIAAMAYCTIALVLLRLAVAWPDIIGTYGAAAELLALLPVAGVLVLLSRQLRPLIVGLAAVLIYLALNFALAAILSTFQLVDVTHTRTWVWVLGAVDFLGGILLVAWLLGREDWQRPLAYVLVAATLAWAADWWFTLSVPLGPAVFGLLSNAAQMWLVWLIFRVFLGLWQRGRWSEQIVHAHVATAFVNGYFLFVVLTAPTLFPTHWAAVSIPAGFVLHVVALHGQLRRIRASSPESPLALLYLRVFAARDLSTSRLRWLEDSWRRIGRVDLIAGADVGLEALGPVMLQRLLQRRAYGEFVTSPARVGERLRSMRTTLGEDARYPVNAFYCYADTWRAAFGHLLADTDVVLMDLREFATAHRGCAFELATLVRRAPLDGIVLIADARTDVAAIDSIAQEAWARLPADSPNAHALDPVLTLIRLDGPRTRHDAVLTQRLVAAAFTNVPARITSVPATATGG